MQARHEELFQPTLPPEKVGAVQRLGIGVVDKLFVTFPEAPEQQEAAADKFPLLWRQTAADLLPGATWPHTSCSWSSQRQAACGTRTLGHASRRRSESLGARASMAETSCLSFATSRSSALMLSPLVFVTGDKCIPWIGSC